MAEHLDGRRTLKSTLNVSPEAALHYSIDEPDDPGKCAGNVVMVHGFGESSEAWRDWVSHLTPNYRVARYDQRGFGRSTPMREGFAWSLDMLANDLVQVIEKVSKQPTHVVAAKIGGPVAIRAAVTRPDLFKSLTLVGTPVKGPQAQAWIEQIRSEGMLAWAKSTMDARMGPDMPAD
jgi:3-oxoadipate enol-lactonase